GRAGWWPAAGPRGPAPRPAIMRTPISPSCWQTSGRSARTRATRTCGKHAAGQPWRFELLLDRHSTDAEWVYKRDARVRLPWDKAAHNVDGVGPLRPEVALLFKAKHDRPKDRADLLAAQLDPSGRDWLADTLDLLGQGEGEGRARGAGEGE